MKITITLECDTADEAADAMERLRGQRFIKPEDRPDAGVDMVKDRPVAAAIATHTAAGMPNVGFGVGVTLPPGATPALFTAAVAASPTAPVAPMATSVAAPSAPPAHAVPPAAVVSAPTAPVAPSTPVPGAVMLDSAGLPWDGRIHASTRTMNKTDGTWRGKRDLDPAVREAVTAELRAGLAANAAAAPQPPQPYIAPEVYAAPLVPAAAAAVPPPPTPAPVPAAAPSAPPSEGWTFSSLMERLTPLMMSGSIKPEQVGASLAKHGLQAIGQLAYSPNVVPLVAADLLA